VHARSGHAGVIRVLFHQHHIADISTACNAPFEQVVAQHRTVRQTPVKYRMDSLDMQQTLAGEAAHAKQVLVEVRDGAAVRVEAALTGKHGVKR